MRDEEAHFIDDALLNMPFKFLELPFCGVRVINIHQFRKRRSSLMRSFCEVRRPCLMSSRDRIMSSASTGSSYQSISIALNESNAASCASLGHVSTRSNMSLSAFFLIPRNYITARKFTHVLACTSRLVNCPLKCNARAVKQGSRNRYCATLKYGFVEP